MACEESTDGAFNHGQDIINDQNPFIKLLSEFTLCISFYESF